MNHDHRRRRGFLKLLGVGMAAGLGLAAAGRGRAMETGRTGRNQQPPEPVTYRETEAFRRYYDSLR